MRTVARERVGAGGPARPAPQGRVVLLVGLAVAAFLVFFPARTLWSEQRRIDRLERRLAALKRENRRLEAEVRRLQDPSELELVARERLGLVRPGERAYLLVPQPTPPAPPAPPARPGPSLRSRAWRAVVRLFRGG